MRRHDAHHRIRGAHEGAPVEQVPGWPTPMPVHVPALPPPQLQPTSAHHATAAAVGLLPAPHRRLAQLAGFLGQGDHCLIRGAHAHARPIHQIAGGASTQAAPADLSPLDMQADISFREPLLDHSGGSRGSSTVWISLVRRVPSVPARPHSRTRWDSRWRLDRATIRA